MEYISQKVNKNGKEKETVFIKEHGLLLSRAENGFLEPTHYDCEMNNGVLEGIEIEEGDFLYDFIMFIRFSERKKITSGKNFGKYKDGFFEVYQWITSIHNLLNMTDMDSARLITVLARQAKPINWSV